MTKKMIFFFFFFMDDLTLNDTDISIETHT
jgi:hypothetical protein